MEHLQNRVLVRGHEIALKGKNRPLFFDQLEHNLRQALQGTAVAQVRKRHMGVEITLSPEAARASLWIILIKRRCWCRITLLLLATPAACGR
ncbi:MAG: hypothetical protein HY672_01095 [Chloroflexi bacterium]|nr:hypothetical protein [Chloroflexota bacterium]